MTEVDHSDFEVIVVGNRDADAPVADIRGSTRIARAATGKIIAFTNDDVVADRRWLWALGERFARTTDLAAVTGLVEPLEL